MIDSLPVLEPNEDRRARTLARCHRALAARRRRIEARIQRQRGARILALERALVTGLCLAYLISMTANVLVILR